MQKRVQEWHDSLRLILENEEKVIEFDVHEYGTRILSCFESIGEQRLFKDLIGGIEKVEVARYFLSLLMMVLIIIFSSLFIYTNITLLY